MIEITCDGNGCKSKNMQIFFCEDCYIELEEKLEEANNRIAEMEKEIEGLQTGD